MRNLLIAALLVGLGAGASADLAFTAIGTPVTINFSGFTAAGFTNSPGAGQLDSDDWIGGGMSDNWVTGVPAYGGTSSNTGDWARGPGSDSITTAGIYNFTNTGNAALGVLATTADFTPGFLRLRIQNNSGSTISAFDFSYDIYYFGNGLTRTQSLSFAWSGDNFVSSSNDVAGLYFGIVDPSTWTTNSRSASGVSGATIANGQYAYFQWSSDDAGGSGNRPRYAIDNISITPIPEPSTMGLFGLAAVGAWMFRRKLLQK